jgi:hypothetical protein
LRNAVIDWPDGDEGEKSHFRDGSRAAVVARLMVRPVCPQLRKCRVRPGQLRLVPTTDTR